MKTGYITYKKAVLGKREAYIEAIGDRRWPNIRPWWLKERQEINE